ncbi:MAG: AMP-binding protein [Deltaproteobacteria bacterium]|nr:AMP-binding protein [Deltaproteobacteria bacterium]MBN2671985.1 AMP-binding protein [Deltaproteobacteria bacterium]
MRNTILITLLQWLLSLRYRITVNAPAQLRATGNSGILFLANHPALIDPLIVMSKLYKRYHPRPLADETQMNRPGLKYLFRLVRPVLIPDVQKAGKTARQRAIAAIERTAAALQNGDNILLYPAGRIYRADAEYLGANSAVETILREVPDATVVLLRTTGLWGSLFSWATGAEPKLRKIIPRAMLALMGAFFFFLPKRSVTIDFSPAFGFPKSGTRSDMNRFMEHYYNQTQHAPVHVPYHVFGKTTQLHNGSNTDASRPEVTISKKTQLGIQRQLTQMTQCTDIEDAQSLALDLGMDSLQKMELALWIENQFHVPSVNVERLETVGDVFKAACDNTQPAVTTETQIHLSRSPSASTKAPLRLPDGETIAAVVLRKARQNPNQVIVADALRGSVTYRQLLTAVFALKPLIQQIPGERVGIVLPASTAAAIAYMAVVFAGKTPVLFNFTTGRAAVAHGVKTTGVQVILTSAVFQQKLRERGPALDDVGAEFVALESLSRRIGFRQKLRALFFAHVMPGLLGYSDIQSVAAILFTSGSETVPKAVPLTHHNILSNLRDLSDSLQLHSNDSLLGILPPFHSFGLTGTVVLPLCIGLSTVYAPNPTESDTLATLVAEHQLTVLLSTPTFLNGMLKQPHSLQSLRLTFVGAEACPTHVYKQFAKRCSNGVLCEGYGITECAPVISMNPVEHPVPKTIGRVLPSMESAIVNDAMTKRVSPGEDGNLLVRGPNVFHGYLNSDAPSPFVEFEGQRWYNTGDMVALQNDNTLIFKGRKKRFIKVAGEMISLPAMEAALLAYTARKQPDAVVAVNPGRSETNELVLFATVPVTVKEANEAIREAGLSSLHRIHSVIHLPELPTLGSGKIDYRTLSATTVQPSNRRHRELLLCTISLHI